MPRATVISPLAAPNITAKAAAVATDRPRAASMTKASTTRPTAKRAIHNECTLRAKKNSISRAVTCDGPNSAPIVTAVPASSPSRWKIASRCAASPEGTNA